MTILRAVVLLPLSFVLINVILALFERLAPRKIVRFYMKHLGNPALRMWCAIAPGYAVVEVTGRRSGRRRQVNVGGRLRDQSFWFLARADSDYLENIRANPSVRVRIHGRWRTGVAHPCPEINPRSQLLKLNAANGLFLWLVGADLETVRVDLSDD